MKHPYLTLRAEYERLLATCRITKPAEVDAVARRLLRSRVRYAAVSVQTGVPIVVLAVLHERESAANFATYLGNGEPLGRVTRLVPKGRGPWREPQAWEKGAIDAITYDRLNDNSAPWSMPYACWKCEAWNGFGPRNRGRHTGYLWSGTNVYTGGKYVADGKWDPGHFDRQLGTVPVMMKMIMLDPTLVLERMPMPIPIAPPPAPAPPPEGVGLVDGIDNAAEIQQALNRLGFGPLLVDGNYGRRTRDAVRKFQASVRITVDGLAGPETIRALERALG